MIVNSDKGSHSLLIYYSTNRIEREWTERILPAGVLKKGQQVTRWFQEEQGVERASTLCLRRPSWDHRKCCLEPLEMNGAFLTRSCHNVTIQIMPAILIIIYHFGSGCYFQLPTQNQSLSLSIHPSKPLDWPLGTNRTCLDEYGMLQLCWLAWCLLGPCFW